jgi:hypothetical protein
MGTVYFQPHIPQIQGGRVNFSSPSAQKVTGLKAILSFVHL